MINWLLRLMLIALLASCTGTQPVAQAPSPKGSGDTNEQLQELRPQIQSRLERHEFLDALRLIEQGVHLGVPESKFAEEYRLALRGGMNYGERLLLKRQFSKCGNYTKRLLMLYPHSLPNIPGVSAVQIKERLNYCSDQLMAQGLAEYRAGQMERAINYWSELLVFNPERTEAQKAIKTCSTQLRNLKKKP